MSLFNRFPEIIGFLRAANPPEDISNDSVVAHPHNTSRAIPERLPAATVKQLSGLEPWRALAATGEEWAAIAVAIGLSSYFQHPALYLVAVLFIGARQHALMILGHDASHYRYLPARWLNDLLGNIFLMWPNFASVAAFRKFHGTHHQYTNLPADGNRHIWHTHNAQGELEPGWTFPKTKFGLAVLLARRVLFLTGIVWIFRGLIGMFIIPAPHWMIAAQAGFYASGASLLTFYSAWSGLFWFWLVPYCTWHIVIQYVRIICEHSAVASDEDEYGITRTTIPTWLESIFVLPRNVGYHLEHHWYPSVPFYRLPELHRQLMARKGFKAHAVVRRSVLISLGECVAPQRS